MSQNCIGVEPFNYVKLVYFKDKKPQGKIFVTNYFSTPKLIRIKTTSPNNYIILPCLTKLNPDEKKVINFYVKNDFASFDFLKSDAFLIEAIDYTFQEIEFETLQSSKFLNEQFKQQQDKYRIKLGLQLEQLLSSDAKSYVSSQSLNKSSQMNQEQQISQFSPYQISSQQSNQNSNSKSSEQITKIEGILPSPQQFKVASGQSYQNSQMPDFTFSKNQNQAPFFKFNQKPNDQKRIFSDYSNTLQQQQQNLQMSNELQQNFKSQEYLKSDQQFPTVQEKYNFLVQRDKSLQKTLQNYKQGFETQVQELEKLKFVQTFSFQQDTKTTNQLQKNEKQSSWSTKKTPLKQKRQFQMWQIILILLLFFVFGVILKRQYLKFYSSYQEL